MELPSGSERRRLVTGGDVIAKHALVVTAAYSQHKAWAATIELVHHLVAMQPCPARQFQCRCARRDSDIYQLVRLKSGKGRVKQYLEAAA
jgi:hypothetical protein